MRLESVGIDWRTPSRLRPRRAAAAGSGRVQEAHRAQAAPAASALDTGAGLIAGSISTGSHDAAWWLPPLVAVAATGASLRRIRG
jgi:hypothetical protein